MSKLTVIPAEESLYVQKAAADAQSRRVTHTQYDLIGDWEMGLGQAGIMQEEIAVERELTILPHKRLVAEISYGVVNPEMGQEDAFLAATTEFHYASGKLFRRQDPVLVAMESVDSQIGPKMPELLWSRSQMQCRLEKSHVEPNPEGGWIRVVDKIVTTPFQAPDGTDLAGDGVEVLWNLWEAKLLNDPLLQVDPEDAMEQKGSGRFDERYIIARDLTDVEIDDSDSEFWENEFSLNEEREFTDAFANAMAQPVKDRYVKVYDQKDREAEVDDLRANPRNLAKELTGNIRSKRMADHLVLMIQALDDENALEKLKERLNGCYTKDTIEAYFAVQAEIPAKERLKEIQVNMKTWYEDDKAVSAAKKSLKDAGFTFASDAINGTKAEYNELREQEEEAIFRLTDGATDRKILNYEDRTRVYGAINVMYGRLTPGMYFNQLKEAGTLAEIFQISRKAKEAMRPADYAAFRPRAITKAQQIKAGL